MATVTQRIDLAVMRASSQDVELEHGQAAALEHDPVAVEPEYGVVEVELEHGQAAAELQADPVVERRTDQAAVELERVPVVVERRTDQAAVELERVPVVVERRTDQVAVELERVPVVVERRTDQAAVELVRGHRHAHLEVPPKTRSVIAPLHPAPVPRLGAVEDLRAVVETTREPAAAEAIRA
jgi:hypothetical protein